MAFAVIIVRWCYGRRSVSPWPVAVATAVERWVIGWGCVHWQHEAVTSLHWRNSTSLPSLRHCTSKCYTVSRKKTTSHFYYARKQLLLSARLSHRNSVRLSARPSGRLSVTWVDQSKTMQDKITKKSSPSAARKTKSSFRNRKAFP